MSEQHNTHGHQHKPRADEPQGARETVQRAYDQTLDGARRAARQTAQGIEANPIAVVLGGLAFGAVAATLIPRSERERELLAPLGQRLNTAVTAAVAAAREAGKNELASAGISRDAARDQVRGLFDSLSKAATSAGSAAAKAATDTQRA